MASAPRFSFANIPGSAEKDRARVLDALRQAGPGRIVVLTMHGVPDTAHPQVTTAPALFEEYLRFLHENRFTVVAMRDLDRMVERARESAPLP